MTPLLYVGGLLATIPSLYGFLMYMWGAATTPAWAAAIPLNLMPLVLCRGLPPLFAASILGTLGGFYHIIAIRGQQQQSHMRITSRLRALTSFSSFRSVARMTYDSEQTTSSR
jgi:hypothetical protein